MYMVLMGLENLNQEDYWKDSKVRFSNSYGSAKMRFDQAYDNSKRVLLTFS
jgi:hypothetical protein